MFSFCTLSCHDTRRWRDTSRCNSEHFIFSTLAHHGMWLSASRYGAVGKIVLHMEFSCSPCSYSPTTIQGGGVTPPGAIPNTLIFSSPARHGTWLSASRYGAVGKFVLHMEFSCSPCAHAHTTIQGGGVTPPGAIRNTLIFWTPACHGTCLSASR
jgi:Fe-S cluster biogenesis protein NfuA